MDPHDELEWLARTAGYGPEAVDLLADAALPGHPPQEELSVAEADRLAGCLEVTVQAGLTERHVLLLIPAYQRDHDTGPGDWRAVWWRRIVRSAARRFRHPGYYGLSPCERDPARLAAWGPPNAPDQRRHPDSPAAHARSRATESGAVAGGLPAGLLDDPSRVTSPVGFADPRAASSPTAPATPATASVPAAAAA